MNLCDIIRYRILGLPKELPPGTYNVVIKNMKVSQDENTTIITCDVERIKNEPNTTR